MRLELKDGQMSNKSLILDKYPGVSGVTSEVKVLRVEKDGKGWKSVGKCIVNAPSFFVRSCHGMSSKIMDH